MISATREPRHRAQVVQNVANRYCATPMNGSKTGADLESIWERWYQSDTLS